MTHSVCHSIRHIAISVHHAACVQRRRCVRIQICVLVVIHIHTTYVLAHRPAGILGARYVGYCHIMHPCMHYLHNHHITDRLLLIPTNEAVQQALQAQGLTTQDLLARDRNALWRMLLSHVVSHKSDVANAVQLINATVSYSGQSVCISLPATHPS